MTETRFLLWRHAKAQSDAASDAERALSERGVLDAAEQARRLVAAGWTPDAVAVSNAQRTRQTWSAGCAAAPELAPARVKVRPDLYLAAPETFGLAVLDALETASCVWVIGHNPGLAQLAEGLARHSGSDPAARAELWGGFPTCCAAGFALSGSTLADARLIRVFPRP
ncbi:MAG: histidine phosphatase family protein [Maricaulaceae bacterium]